MDWKKHSMPILIDKNVVYEDKKEVASSPNKTKRLYFDESKLDEIKKDKLCFDHGKLEDDYEIECVYDKELKKFIYEKKNVDK